MIHSNFHAAPTATATATATLANTHNNSNLNNSTEAKSMTSNRSISARSRGAGSAVLARAREYNRIIDENKSQSQNQSRSRSKSRSKYEHGYGQGQGQQGFQHVHAQGYELNRSKSTPSPRMTSNPQLQQFTHSQTQSQQRNQKQQQQQHHNNQHGKHQNPNRYRSSPTPSQKSASARTHKSYTQQQQQQQHRYSHSPQNRRSPSPVRNNSNYNKENNYRSSSSQTQQTLSSSKSQTRSSTSKSNHHTQNNNPDQTHTNNNNNNNNQAIVTPELLVDALSGHEDGLLAIAERLMEHYDSGYDAMGEAIIDAFADVQKLFQHVVEAAHMEGAAYEAGRKEEEIEVLKKKLNGMMGVGGSHGMGDGIDGDCHDQQQLYNQRHNQQQQHGGTTTTPSNNHRQNTTNNTNSPVRHEEFVDQDVRDILSSAIRKGQSYKESQKYTECYNLYEQACNSASALLPVDSDHRGRLQLSIARAESMNAERACAILKYVMDDVLRSGLTSNSKVVMPDPSQRGDCVLSRPPPASKVMDDTLLHSKYNGTTVSGRGENGVVLQSSEEALASMVEEMKEILSAPVYDNSPLQGVAERFWTSLSEAQRNNAKTEERLEQKLGELKGDFLLAKMEWEEKYNTLSRECENQKRKVERLRNQNYMEQAKQGVQTLVKESSDNNERYHHYHDDHHSHNNLDSPRSGRPSSSSVASFASFSHHAKSIVTNFSCNGEREFADQQQQNQQRKSYGSRIKHSSSRLGETIRSSPQSSRQRSPFRGLVTKRQ